MQKLFLLNFGRRWLLLILVIFLSGQGNSATLTHTTYEDFSPGDRYAVEIIGTPNATLQLTRPLLFEDKFDEPDGPAKNWTPQAAPPGGITGTWTVKNKTYEADAKVRGGWCYSVAGSDAWENYIYEAKCRLEDSAPAADYITVGIAFRYRDINNFFRFRYIESSLGRRVDLYARVNGGWILLASSPYVLQYKKWYFFKVEVRRITAVDVRINCYVNGQLFINYEGPYNDDLPSGRIALYNYQTLTYYDDVLVSDLKDIYNPKGTFTSGCINLKGNADFGTISWQPLAQPANTQLKIQLATNNDAQTWNFIGPDGSPNTYYTNALGTSIYSGHDQDKYLKYRVLFDTQDTSFTPTLDSITITYTTITSNPAPPDINLLTAEDTKVGDSVKLTWERSPDTSVVGYKVYYGPNYFVNVDDATLYGTINNPDITESEVIGLTTDHLYYFAVTAFDAEGNEDKNPQDIYTAIPTYGSIFVIFSERGVRTPEDPAQIKEILNKLGYIGEYGCWSVAKRGWPTLDRLRKFNVVLFFSGGILNDSITRAFAGVLYSYVQDGGNVALLGENMGFDATDDRWINTSDFQNLFRVANYTDSVGDGNAMLPVSHAITKYIGGTGTTFYCTGFSLDGYRTLVETTYTREIISWTQNATFRICAVAYDGHQRSPKEGRIFYFSGVFYDARGRGIQSPQVRENLIKGLLEWLCEPVSTTPSYIEITPKAATLTAGTSFNFSCQGYDELGNPIANLDYTWSILGDIGTVSPNTGKTTTFTATPTNTIIYGSLTATSLGVTGSASVCVRPALLSIKIEPSNIDWGTLTPNTKSFVATVTITNTGSVAQDFYFLVGTFTTGTYTWSLGTTTGIDRCVLEYSTNTTTYYTITTYNTNILIFTNVPENTSRLLYLQITTPQVTSSQGRYRSNVTFSAEASP